MGAIVGVHFLSEITETKGFKEVFYHGAVPVHRMLWDFPQILGADRFRVLLPSQRRALIAYYFLQDRYGAAMIECRRAVADDPRDGVANAYMYRIAQIQGAPALAAQYLQVAADRPESRVLVAFLAGRTALEIDDYQAALKWADKAIALSPENAEGYLIRGHAQLNLGQFDQAEVSFRNALRRGLELHPEAEAMLGVVTVNRWLVENRALKFLPGIVPPPGLVSEARRRLNRSMELWPSRNWIAHLYLGVLAELIGDEREALKRRNQAFTVGDGNADALLTVSWFDLMRGESNGALEEALEAQRIRETARGHLFVGWSLLQAAEKLAGAGKVQEASKATLAAALRYRRAVQMSPDAFWAPAARQVLAFLPTDGRELR